MDKEVITSGRFSSNTDHFYPVNSRKAKRTWKGFERSHWHQCTASQIELSRLNNFHLCRPMNNWCLEGARLGLTGFAINFAGHEAISRLASHFPI